MLKERYVKSYRLQALENIITEDGYEIEHYSIFSYFPVAKDNIKEMIQDFKKEEENNE